MMKIVDKLIWFLTGILVTHIGHYLYQIRYAKAFQAGGTSEAIATMLEDLLGIILSTLDNLLPFMMAHQFYLLLLLTLVLALMLFWLGFGLYQKRQHQLQYNKIIKEAEEIRSQAESEAAAKIEENKLLKKRLINDFQAKEQALQQRYNEKVAEYKQQLKKLNQEKLELKETVGNLMHRLKNR